MRQISAYRLPRPILICVLAGAIVSASLCAWLSSEPEKKPTGKRAPEFTAKDKKDWINSPPLRLSDLSDKVVMLQVWTFSCWNCIGSLPWIKEVYGKYKDRGFVVVGIHTPEFENEKDPDKVLAHVKRHGMTYPNMIDANYTYWNALGNRYWPAFYILDKNGYIRSYAAGETHTGDPRARELEREIGRLLSESKRN